MTGHEWYDAEEKAIPRPFPDLFPADVMVSMKHGNLISKLIAFFQRDGKGDEFSHVAVYVGNGQIAEATYPKGRVTSLRRYLDKSHSLTLYRTTLRADMREAICISAIAFSSRPYGKWDLVRRLVDNVIEKVTWNEKTQSGARPLAKLFKDPDSRLVCSELVERAYSEGAGVRFQDGQLGQADPDDVSRWFRQHGWPLLTTSHGEIVAGD